MRHPVSIVTVTRNGFFFSRLLIEKIRQHTVDRDYEIIVIDRGSKDGSRDWLRQQPDVQFIGFRQWRTSGHGHAEAAERGIKAARYDRIVLIDSDAHPLGDRWLAESADALDDSHRLAGAVFVDKHKGNPHGWYIHPHFMTFFKADLGGLIVLRKIQGEDVDTAEQSTVNVLAAGLQVVKLPMTQCARFDVGNPGIPTEAGDVFHAWYVSRLENNEADVIRESEGKVSRSLYLDPLVARLRAAYGLAY
jgi:glycosyltransferase involved in cell wall biosynthesis